MAENLSPEDSLALSAKLTSIGEAFESLQRNAADRRAMLEQGLVEVRGDGCKVWVGGCGLKGDDMKC